MLRAAVEMSFLVIINISPARSCFELNFGMTCIDSNCVYTQNQALFMNTTMNDGHDNDEDDEEEDEDNKDCCLSLSLPLFLLFCVGNRRGEASEVSP